MRETMQTPAINYCLKEAAIDSNMMTTIFCDIDGFVKNLYIYQWSHDTHHGGFHCFKHFYQMLLEIKKRITP